MDTPRSPVRVILGVVIALMLILLPVVLKAGPAVWAPFLIVLGTALGVAALVRSSA